MIAGCALAAQDGLMHLFRAVTVDLRKSALGHLCSGVRQRIGTCVVRFVLSLSVPPPKKRFEMVRLGTGYGGWWVPAEKANLRFGTCFSVGAGEDISFDIELANKFDARVVVVDPTPRALLHFMAVTAEIQDQSKYGHQTSHEEHDESPNGSFGHLKFLNVGVWDSDTIQKFFAPKISTHVSHSITNLQATTNYFEAQCYSIKTLFSLFGAGNVPCLLKLDIEGAEHRVVGQMLDDGIRPEVLLIEFDDYSLGEMFKTGKKLRNFGYHRAKVENRNALFVRS